MFKNVLFRQEDNGAGNNAPPAGDATGTNGGDEKRFTQAELDAIVKARLEREQGKAAKDREKAEADARARALAEQGEFKTLAEQRAARIAELEPLATETEQLRMATKALLDRQREGLPEYILPLLDAMPVAGQLEYLAKNRDKLITPQQTQAPNINSGAGNGRPGPNDTIAANAERLGRIGRRGNF